MHPCRNRGLREGIFCSNSCNTWDRTTAIYSFGRSPCTDTGSSVRVGTHTWHTHTCHTMKGTHTTSRDMIHDTMVGGDSQLCPADNKLFALDSICHKEKQVRSEPLGAVLLGTGQRIELLALGRNRLSLSPGSVVTKCFHRVVEGQARRSKSLSSCPASPAIIFREGGVKERREGG